jgi:cytochrome c553
LNIQLVEQLPTVGGGSTAAAALLRLLVTSTAAKARPAVHATVASTLWLLWMVMLRDAAACSCCHPAAVTVAPANKTPNIKDAQQQHCQSHTWQRLE